MGKSKKKKGSQNLIVIIMYMVLGMVCGLMSVASPYSIASVESPIGEFTVQLLFVVIFMYLAIFLNLIIHEFGHLVFGLLTGYKFCSFRIANLMWIKQNEKVKFKKYSLAGTGGQCLLSPPNLVNGKMPFVLYNLGGSLMNIISAVIFVGVFFLAKNITLIAFISQLMIIIGIGTALMNGIPMRLGTVDNDGYNTLSMSKSSEALRAFWIQMKINEQMTKGVRIKYMPSDWFYIPSEGEMKNSICSSIAVFYENRLMDEQKFSEASQLIDRLINEDNAVIGLYSNLLACDRIYCELIGSRDTNIIEQLKTKELLAIMQQMKNYPSIIRTEYALALLLENDRAKAEKIKARFEKVAKTHPYPSEIESEQELIEIVDKICS